MAQISTIKYSDILEAHRYDAEYFKPEYLEIERNIRKQSFSHFGELTRLFVKGIFDINSDVYTTHGIPFVRISNLKNSIIDDSDIVYITEEENKKNKKTELRYSDIILSKTAYPACSLVTLERCNTSQDTIAIKLKADARISSKFLVIFLNTKYGISQMRRYFTGNIQMHLNLTESKQILVPSLPSLFQKEISDLFDESIEKQVQSKQLYHEANEILLKELGLLNYQIKHNLAFSATKKEIEQSGRFDSEYFQPKYKEIIEKIEKYDGGWNTLENVIKFKDKNFIPKDGEKYKYLALSNISSQGYIKDYQEELGKNLPSRARRRIHTGDVIISSIEGSLSSCAIVDEEFDSAVCSTGFFVLNSEKINPETLLILFKSSIIQELLQRGTKGTILTAISKTELEYIRLPLVKKSVQQQIAARIQESHQLRKESKKLLEETKKKVEEEIERR